MTSRVGRIWIEKGGGRVREGARGSVRRRGRWRRRVARGETRTREEKAGMRGGVHVPKGGEIQCVRRALPVPADFLHGNGVVLPELEHIQ